jgi:hypothetical protein
MLNRIVDLSLRYKLLVLLAFVLMAFFGVRAFLNVPVDAFPDVTPNQVNVYTESPGLAAEDVEQLLTTPIETAMAGLPGVEQIRSVSLFGLSYVGVYFKDGVDIYFARRLVGEKLQEQITESIKFDCHDDDEFLDSCYPIFTGTPQEWRERQLAKEHQSLAYHNENRQGEIERTRQRNEWVKALRGSLSVNQ